LNIIGGASYWLSYGPYGTKVFSSQMRITELVFEKEKIDTKKASIMRLFMITRRALVT